MGHISIANLNGTFAFYPGQHHRAIAVRFHRFSDALHRQGEIFMR